MIGTVKERMRGALRKISSELAAADLEDHDLVIWGAGNTAVLCQEAFRRHSIAPLCYIDGNEAKQKDPFYGHKVLSPEYLDAVDDPIVMICSGNVGFTNEIRSELERKGLKNFTVDEYFFGNNADRIIVAADMLDDKRSAEVFCGMILNRLNNRLPSADIIDGDQYFVLPQFRKIPAGDVFVNIGAYKGEEVEKYLGYCGGRDFGKIISFEPDGDNYSEMLSLINTLNGKYGIEEGKIQCVMAALGDMTTTSSFRSGHGTNSSIGGTVGGGPSSIDIYSLDDFMPNERADFLKADIESFEMKMLSGARRTIVNNSPRIAVSIYHSPADLFEIIEYLSSLDLGYKFSVRHHSDRFADTVLYAYIG